MQKLADLGCDTFCHMANTRAADYGNTQASIAGKRTAVNASNTFEAPRAYIQQSGKPDNAAYTKQDCNELMRQFIDRVAPHLVGAMQSAQGCICLMQHIIT